MMRARWMVALVVATAAVAVFDWRGRGNGPSQLSRPAGSTEWLADVSAHTAAARAVGYLLELVVTAPDERTVVLRERGASDTDQRHQWRSVELRNGDDALPPIRVLVGDDSMWLSPGFIAEPFGLEPTAWIGASLGAVDPLRWDDVLPRSARKMRDLLHKGIGDAVVVGRENLRQVGTTHVQSWIGDRPLDLWVGDDQRLRRVEFVNEDRDEAQVKLRLELFDYDEPVEIHPPDPTDVLADEELATRILGRLPGRGP